ncbi:serine protease [Alisedimentitalea sp. MJ-SS2]|uniref:trypsin-like serine peptidase n=1 Tax=Aliisedimentitalea sp. MJ-SS2 TaxID=3049795 RepID=UPI002910B128|nr:serine protease [Alisedimentitalea sp. MJ-SS2]MDU8929929.1 serine protease [Alisedimentitalea sp. MJ-SS2]
MNEEDIRKRYFDDKSLTDGQEPLVKAGDKVIAGEDDRKDVYELVGGNAEQQLHLELVQSTVILTDKSDLTDNGNGTLTMAVAPFRQRNLPPCSDERFANQFVGGWCSGFLVGDDLIATAGHCGRSENDIQNTAYVFGFFASSPTDPGRMVFNEDQVYFGRELVAFDESGTGDYAIVRLDRKVDAPGAKPLKVRTSGEPSDGVNLGVIGYPSGLPVKVAFGDETRLMRKQDPWLIANLDTYGGNSGSAVFNSDGEVEGILVRGAVDYRFTGFCFRSNRIENSDGSEAVTKAGVFQDKIPT